MYVFFVVAEQYFEATCYLILHSFWREEFGRRQSLQHFEYCTLYSTVYIPRYSQFFEKLLQINYHLNTLSQRPRQVLMINKLEVENLVGLYL